MVKIAPSILAADFDNLENEIKKAEMAGADMIHVDVMDGKFVNNKTNGYEMYKKARETTNLFVDTHLMVNNPEDWVDDFLLSDNISFHIESVDFNTANNIIDKLHKNQVKAGIALKPDTMVEDIIPFLNRIDMVLIMTVEPGFGGQKMIEKCLEKVSIIKNILPNIDIEVDGGINIDTCKTAKRMGANILVAGTAIFCSKNIKKVIDEMKKDIYM